MIFKIQRNNSKERPISNSVFGIKSKVFDIVAVLKGAYYGDVGFVGKIWLRLKIKNNTHRSFEKPISLFLTTKDYQVSERKIGRRCPDNGVVLISDFTLDASEESWKPGKEIVLTREIGIGTNNFQDNEWEFFKYLTKDLRLPTNEPIKIDKYVSIFFDMSFSTPLDSFKDNYICEKLKKKISQN